MGYEHDALPLRSYPHFDFDTLTPSVMAAQLYQAMLQRHAYATPNEPFEAAAQRDVWDSFRDAKVCVFDVTLLRDLALQWSAKSQIPKGQEIWPAGHTEPYPRHDWEARWPGATPPRPTPPFADTFVVFSEPITAMIRTAPGGEDDTLIVGLLLSGDLCMGISLHAGRLYMVLLYDENLVYYTMGAYIAYVALDALMRPEIEMRTDHFSRAQKKKLQRVGAKVTMGAPAPFYEVRMVSRPGSSEPNPNPKHIEWSHRWDVRSHQRCLIRRGVLPLRDKDRVRLTMRGYTICEGPSIPFEMARALDLRGKPPKRDDEWVAIKTSLVRGHQRGPEDKPYVPSVHVEEWTDRMEA